MGIKYFLILKEKGNEKRKKREKEEKKYIYLIKKYLIYNTNWHFNRNFSIELKYTIF